MGSNPIEVLNFFRLLYAIAFDCIHNCEDQSSFDFISAVHMTHFIYITHYYYYYKPSWHSTHSKEDLGVERLRPLAGVQSQTETKQLFNRC